MNFIPIPSYLRPLSFLLTLTITGLTGFLHPVLCLEGNGRVRLEMDASQCCAIVPAPPQAQATRPSELATRASGCDDCVDIHFSNQGSMASSLRLPALSPRVAAGAPHSAPINVLASFSSLESVRPSPPPPSNLRC